MIPGVGLALAAAHGAGLSAVAGGDCPRSAVPGPRLVAGGSVILAGDRAVPLPYFVLERLPGFGSLSLLYRLAVGPALAAALLAAVGYGRLAARRPALRWLPLAVVLALLTEKRVVSPLTTLPDAVDVRPASVLETLAESPRCGPELPGGGGRPYLYEQIVHHSLAGTPTFRTTEPGSASEGLAPPRRRRAGRLARRASSAAKARECGTWGPRDALARPDQHDAVKAIEAAFLPSRYGTAATRCRFPCGCTCCGDAQPPVSWGGRLSPPSRGTRGPSGAVLSWPA